MLIYWLLSFDKTALQKPRYLSWADSQASFNNDLKFKFL